MTTTEVFRRAREKSIFNRYVNVYEIFDWGKNEKKTDSVSSPLLGTTENSMKIRRTLPLNVCARAYILIVVARIYNIYNILYYSVYFIDGKILQNCIF